MFTGIEDVSLRSVLAGGLHFAVEEQNVFYEKPFLRRKIVKIHFHLDTGGMKQLKINNIIAT
ncbi:hypothetical protein FACS1894189_1230 [Planctomycetales bacterium]|nr:hypothetical protein FACS1894189_1230 [Planctomycetales bacterium]